MVGLSVESMSAQTATMATNFFKSAPSFRCRAVPYFCNYSIYIWILQYVHGEARLYYIWYLDIGYAEYGLIAMSLYSAALSNLSPILSMDITCGAGTTPASIVSADDIGIRCGLE